MPESQVLNMESYTNIILGSTDVMGKCYIFSVITLLLKYEYECREQIAIATQYLDLCHK